MVEMSNLKTMEGQFLRELQNDFGFASVVAHAVLRRSKGGGLPSQMDYPKIGQMKVIAVSANEPAGKPLSQCKMVTIFLTIDNGKDDLETLQENGAIGLRRVILSRIANEAVEQGAYLTEEDAARVLRCDPRTIKRDVKHFRDQGIYIPFRGHMVNTGRGQTHKMAIVRWYIQGMTYTEIKRRTNHSMSAISRYVDMFGRVIILMHRGLTVPAIAQVISISETLAEEYVKLYDELNKPEYRDQIDRIVEKVRIPRELKDLKKRRMV